MKAPNLLLFLLISLQAICQKTTKENIFEKVSNYYINNPTQTEIIETVHKNVLGFDTAKHTMTYAKNLNGKTGSYAFANLGDSNKIKSMVLFDEAYYWIEKSGTYKIKYKNSELENSPVYMFDLIPSHNPTKLEENFGKPSILFKQRNNWVLLTSKYQLTVDTSTYRILKVLQTEYFEGKTGFTAYNYSSPNHASTKLSRQQMDELVKASIDYPIVTFKDLKKKKIQPITFENSKFAFSKLVALNVPNVDSILKGKYLIFDFFYQSCYPCHQMTGYILEWMPTMDTSKIVLVGIDPVDGDAGMKKFIADRKINYPIITGKLAKEIRTYYKIQVYPTLLLISPDGTIKIVHEGMSKSFLEKAERIVKKQ